MASPLMIGIAGHSGAGKSTLARCLALRLVGTAEAVLSLDSYYHDQRASGSDGSPPPDFDTPDAMDLDLLSAHLTQLSRSRTVHRPVYDFRTHRRSAQTVPLIPGPAIIVEGRLAFYREDLRSCFSTAIFVTVDEHTCLARRVVRDTRERGRTAISVTRQWQETVQPMFERYVAPTERYADVVVKGTQPLETMADEVLRHLHQRRWTSAAG